MKFNSINVIIFASVLSCAFAATALGPAETDPSHPNMCFDSEHNKFFAPGETWQLDYCGVATCSMHNDSGTPRLMVGYASCGVSAVDPPCYLKEDKSKQYPDCCPQPECPEDFENEKENSAEHVEEGDDDFLNEIEDDEQGDSMYNHKYNNKMADDNSVKDPSRLTKEEEEESKGYLKQVDTAVPSNINKYHIARRNHFLTSQDLIDEEEEEDRRFPKTIRTYVDPHILLELQRKLVRENPQLRRMSPRFSYLDNSEEYFKDTNFEWL